MQRFIRNLGWPTVVGIFAVLAIAASSLILAIGYRDQVNTLRHTIYQRCLQRDAYDHASQQARAAQATYYRALLTNLHHHPSRQGSAFDTELERNVRRVITGLQGALDNGAPRGCAAYR